MSETIPATGSAQVAERIVLSYRETGVDPSGEDGWVLADSEWIAREMTDDTYLTYLRRAHGGEVREGEEWEEFANCGCKRPQDVIVRVEELVGGTVFGEETDIEIRPLAAFVEA